MRSFVFVAVCIFLCCGSTKAQSNLTVNQAVYIISTIGAFYFILFVTILTLVVCFCYKKRKGRGVCPISKNAEPEKPRRPAHKEYTQVTPTSAKPHSKKQLRIVKTTNAGAEVKQSPFKLDAVAYGNPAFHSDQSSTTSDSRSKESKERVSGNTRR
ncbi:PREDICTED: uncharacterized protein LOC100635990 isoform X2 [Amphimedon queenslandica]|uniref:Uncharacterized protein n=1 Tax=Amphimedon queenslandica TaxID=400682 RepID=A0A1X7US15_AMPQE|nr:PREDICTED: uncharacterized protein LOC100635990 isoform X2 [Amphimedon queenslandica]|eukprot:XP_003386952.1 PREDICTED: uncharacterized protein LOC100635990 isoform X2 [Amphimedon queenslandica]